MKRVLVTGATRPLGRRLLQRLDQEPSVEEAIGVEARATRKPVKGVTVLPFESDGRELARFLADRGIDTVIHAGMTPLRSGSFSDRGPAEVITTMRLCAAAGSGVASVRSLVLVSSSAVYPVDSYAPLLHRETDATGDAEVEPVASLLEAEEYARDVALRVGHLDVAILRLAELAGDGIGGPIGSALLQPVMPSPLGYDPHVQWLHVDDALDAILFAGRVELAGLYNVASRGVLRWSEARKIRGGWSLPVLPSEAGIFGGLLRRAAVPHLPEGTASLLRFGSAVDCAKLRSAGWLPRRDQRSCVEALAR